MTATQHAETDWMGKAKEAARWAYEGKPLLGGLYVDDKLPQLGEFVMVLYNASQHSAPFNRECELESFRAILRRDGIRELAYATYSPPGAKDDGDAYALVIEGGCPEHPAKYSIEDLQDEWGRIVHGITPADEDKPPWKP